MADMGIGGPIYLNGEANRCLLDLVPDAPDWESQFKRMSTLTPIDFLQRFENLGEKYDLKFEKVLEKIGELKDEFGEMTAAALRKDGVDKEWVRMVKDHEEMIHGLPGARDKGLEKTMERMGGVMERVVASMELIEKKHAVTRSRTWDVFSGVFVAIAVLAIAHYLGLKP